MSAATHQAGAYRVRMRVVSVRERFKALCETLRAVDDDELLILLLEEALGVKVENVSRDLDTAVTMVLDLKRGC